MGKQAEMRDFSRDFSRLPQMESLLAGSKRIKCTQNKKNQYGHNFIYFHKNTLIIFLFYIFTTLHQKFMYNCQVREKYVHVHFFQFHLDEWLVLWKQKGAKKRQLWTQRKQVIERWLLNSIIILVERRVRGNQCKECLNYTWPVYRSHFTMTRSRRYSVTYNYNLSHKHRYAAFVKHVRSRFTWRSFTRIKTQVPRGKSRNEQLCSKKNGKL